MKIGNYRAVAGISAFGLVLGSWVAFAATADVTEAKPVALSICVQPEAGGAADALSKVSAAAGALPDSHARERSKAALAGAPIETTALLPPDVTPGCPHGFVEPDADRLKLRVSVQATPVTAFPSHNLHVFVVRDGSVLAPDAPGYVRLPYEMSCLEHICAEVSTALYIKESVLSDRALTLRALEEAAGYATLSRFAEGRPTE